MYTPLHFLMFLLSSHHLINDQSFIGVNVNGTVRISFIEEQRNKVKEEKKKV